MRLTVVAAASLALIGCQQDKPADEAPAKAITVRSAQQNALVEATDLNRAIALKRAVVANGYRCQRVEESHFVGQYKNMDVWAASCGDDRDWALFIGADDSVQVRLCKDVTKVELPSCDTRGTPPATKKPATQNAAG